MHANVMCDSLINTSSGIKVLLDLEDGREGR